MKTLLLLLALVWSQTTFAQSVCQPYNTVLLGNAIHNVGNLEVTNDATNLYIDVTSDSANGWSFDNLLIYAGTGPIPEITGIPLPGVFPFQSAYTSATSAHIVIPFANISGSCGQALQIALYTVMRTHDSNGNIILAEETWGFGDITFTGDANAFGFDYITCCQDVGNVGCTNSQGYYKNHNASGKKANYKPWPIPENSTLCGKRWLDILNTNAKTGDAWTILAQQWIAAMLNDATGASTGSIVDDALVNSQTILTSNCSTLPKSGSTRQLALEYSLLLESYNKGLTGPGMCIAQ